MLQHFSSYGTKTLFWEQVAYKKQMFLVAPLWNKPRIPSLVGKNRMLSSFESYSDNWLAVYESLHQMYDIVAFNTLNPHYCVTIIFYMVYHFLINNRWIVSTKCMTSFLFLFYQTFPRDFPLNKIIYYTSQVKNGFHQYWFSYFYLGSLPLSNFSREIDNTFIVWSCCFLLFLFKRIAFWGLLVLWG